MKLLLDTHTLLWWLAGDAQLGPQARALIADAENDVLVSVVSLWEIVVKRRIGKLQASIRQITASLNTEGFTRLPIGDGHLLALARLPSHHRDPFDHLLLAQAIAEDAVFISDDQYAPLYQVRVIRCSAQASPR